MKYGLQLYSVRDAAEKDWVSAVKQVAEMGYDMIETAGFFGLDADTVKSTLDACGVTLSGTHTHLRELLEDYEGTLAFHKAIGNHYYIIPGHDLSTKEKLDAFIDDVNRLQPMLKAEGIELCYHNHAHEFVPNEDGQIIYDELISRTSLLLEIDTYWAFDGGKDPVQLMEQLKDRLRFIHIKDGEGGHKGKPLGHGVAPIRAVWEKAKEMNIPMVVESETLTPDGLTEARLRIEWLRQQG